MIEDHYEIRSPIWIASHGGSRSRSNHLEFMGKKGIPLDNFMDNTIIEKLTREGFFERLYKKS